MPVIIRILGFRFPACSFLVVNASDAFKIPFYLAPWQIFQFHLACSLLVALVILLTCFASRQKTQRIGFTYCVLGKNRSGNWKLRLFHLGFSNAALSLWPSKGWIGFSISVEHLKKPSAVLKDTNSCHIVTIRIRRHVFCVTDKVRLMLTCFIPSFLYLCLKSHLLFLCGNVFHT